MTRLGRAWLALTGICDVLAGLLLVLVPRRALALMRVDDPLTEDAWMRFIGAFVLGVGLLSFYALLRPRGGRAAHVVESATLVRACIAVFTGGAVAAGLLSPAWLLVCLTDATVAVAQVVLLRRRAFGHAA